mgnify:CR=1 FL=1
MQKMREFRTGEGEEREMKPEDFYNRYIKAHKDLFHQNVRLDFSPVAFSGRGAIYLVNEPVMDRDDMQFITGYARGLLTIPGINPAKNELLLIYDARKSFFDGLISELTTLKNNSIAKAVKKQLVEAKKENGRQLRAGCNIMPRHHKDLDEFITLHFKRW